MNRKSGFLAALLVLLSVLVISFAAADDYDYAPGPAGDQSVQITGYHGTDTQVFLPGLIGGLPVKAIAPDAFLDCADLERIDLPAALESIGDSAFNGCSALQYSVMAETVKTVDQYAYQNCISMVSVYIPEVIESLDPTAFRGCAQLARIYFGGTEEQWSAVGSGLETPEDCTVIFNHRHEDTGNGYCVCFKPMGGHQSYNDHRFSDPVYTWSEDGKKCTASRFCDCGDIEYETVDTKVEKSQPSTCVSGGKRVLSAAFANPGFEDQEKTVNLPTSGHSPVTVAAVRGTCIEPGKTEGTVCSVCGQVLSGCVMSERDPDNHVGPMSHPDDILATCISTGYHFEGQCDACGVVIGNETPPDPYRHDGSLWSFPAVEATCTEDGNTAYWHCPRCQNYYSDAAGRSAIGAGSWVIPALGHIVVTDPAVPATCTETGLTEGSHCSLCGDILVPQDIVPIEGHHYDENGVCTVCGAPMD